MYTNGTGFSSSSTFSVEIERAMEEAIAICVAELLKSAKTIADSDFSINVMYEPFAAGGKKGFLYKSLSGLVRCLQLSPDYPRVLFYYERAARALGVRKPKS